MGEVFGLKAYDVDDHIVEIYDQTETQTEDVSLLRELVAGLGVLKILEPFCGNGRILLALAQDGHEMVGMDKSQPMLKSARQKVHERFGGIDQRVCLLQREVITEPWPRGFDLVILGANCLYELATPAEQEACIFQASQSLNRGGYLFLDNNHMEGELDHRWCESGIHTGRFPTGRCADGTNIEGSTETIWFDRRQRLVRFRRRVKLTGPDGRISTQEWIEQKHPPSTEEMESWLAKQGFEVLARWGDRKRAIYRDDSPRAIFWARRSHQGA